MCEHIINLIWAVFIGAAVGAVIITPFAIVSRLQQMLNELRRCRRLLVDIADNTQHPEP